MLAYLLLAFPFAQPAPMRFAETPLPFRYESGDRGGHDLVEIMGGGVGLIDFDGDGRLDVYLCQGGPIVREPGKADPPCRIFRNKGDRTFEDATDRASAPGPSYAMGAAVGDYDGDGRPDLFVSGWRGSRLYRNRGGSFEDATTSAGVGSDRWTTSAAFADLDADGDLDLYVAAYVEFDPLSAPYVAAPDGRRDYPGPEDFPAQFDHLFRNNGDGTFTDVAKESGVALPGGRGLGVVAADFDGDGRLDLYVANDGTPCRLFLNRGGLKFMEIGDKAGVAVDGRGEPLAGMGIVRADLDGDGRLDLAVTNFLGRSTVLFRNERAGVFSDVSEAVGLAAATRAVLGFGVAGVDLDGDGRPELVQANGHVLDRGRLGIPFAMRPSLLRNVDGRFRPEPFVERESLGRGLATGDLDGDGRLDLVIASLDAPPVVLWNETEGAEGIVLDLVPKGGRSPIGTIVRTRIDRLELALEVVGGGSYLSASDSRPVLPLRTGRIETRWPSGRIEVRDAPKSAGRFRWEER